MPLEPKYAGLIGLFELPVGQDCLHTPDGAVVEAPFALLDEQVEVLPGDAVVAASSSPASRSGASAAKATKITSRSFVVKQDR